MDKKEKRGSLALKLTESAIMLALATVLSYFKLIDLPYGGSITLCSMLPMIIVSYRHGLLWGFGAGFANGILQLLFGLKNLSYATSAAAAIAIILLDYIFAFAFSGFGGIFRGKLKSQQSEIVMATTLVCILRYAAHVISGCTVWAGLSIPNTQALLYSLAYNATYMLPELLITVVGAAYLATAVDLKADNITRIKTQKEQGAPFAVKLVGALALVVAFIADVLLIAPKLQNSDSGEFDISGIVNVNFTAVIIASLCGMLIFTVCKVISSGLKNKR